jgi:excisionase family DNA binding protein
MNGTTATPAAEGLWTARDVAAFLNVSRSWVYLRAAAGDLPTQRVGSLLRFEPEAIRAYARGERQGLAKVAVFPPRRG